MIEEKYVDVVEEFLKKRGFQTWKEVEPNECKQWKNSYRVDLIFFKEEYGYIGVEFKNLRTTRQGGKIAKSIEQIRKKYIHMTYFENNIKISKWCLCFDTSDYGDWISIDTILHMSIFLKHFLNYYGLSFMEFEKYKIKIDHSTKQSIIIQ